MSSPVAASVTVQLTARVRWPDPWRTVTCIPSTVARTRFCITRGARMKELQTRSPSRLAFTRYLPAGRYTFLETRVKFSAVVRAGSGCSPKSTSVIRVSLLSSSL